MSVRLGRADARAILLGLSILLGSSVRAEQPSLPASGNERLLWRKAVAGDVLAAPVARDKSVYVVVADRTVKCLSRDGGFLWSGPLPGRPIPSLTVTESGYVYAACENGAIVAFNADGLFLWRVRGPGVPLIAPTEGRDGRLFVLFPDTIVCLSHAGARKWSLSLPSRPIGEPGETADGNLLVPLADGSLFACTPFGDFLGMVTLDAKANSIAPIPGGFACAFPDGTARGFDFRPNREGRGYRAEGVWTARTGSLAALALFRDGGSLVACNADGTVTARNVTDGSELWSTSIPGLRTAKSARISLLYGQYTVLFPDSIAALDEGGTLAWRFDLPAGLSSPAVSEGGDIFAVGSNWDLHAYRAETRILAKKKPREPGSYGILDGNAGITGFAFVADRQRLSAYFDEISAEIAACSVAGREVEHARRLADVARGRPMDPYFPREYDAAERARAAALLGQLGSFSFRDVLVEVLAESRDPTVSIGALMGIAATGWDPDGRALEAVRRAARQWGFVDGDVAQAACDAAYAIMRYNAGERGLEATKLLVEFSREPYPGQTRAYARKLMGALLER